LFGDAARCCADRAVIDLAVASAPAIAPRKIRLDLFMMGTQPDRIDRFASTSMLPALTSLLFVRRITASLEDLPTADTME
jgi:hypothetical protein